MNQVNLMGRIVRDPEIRYTTSSDPRTVARYTLAVDRRRSSRDGGDQQTADFISCVAFGRVGDFVEKYLHKGMRILVTGSLHTGSYVNKDGQKIYTTDVWVDNHEFCESKNSGESSPSTGTSTHAPSAQAVEPSYGQQMSFDDGFMAIPDGVDDDALPFN